MRIGIDIQCLTRSRTGVAYYTVGLLKGLASIPLDDEICPFYFSRRSNIDLPAPVYKKLAPIGKKIPGRILNLGWKRLGFPPLNWLVRGMDCYHFTDFVARPVKRKPVVVTIYDLAFKRFPEFIEPRNLKYLESFVPASLDRADRIIAISKFTQNELTSLFDIPAGKIRVVYGGIDDIFRRPVTEDELIRARYRFNLPRKYILTVGTWEPRKNLVRLLEAWKILRSQGTIGDFKLVMVGMKGWLYGEIEQKFRNLAGRRGVRSIGYIPRTSLPALYRGAEAFIFPSLYEGQGFPPLEAMACGVPVASSRAASLPEVLGDAVLYFDPANPREIAEAISGLLKNPEKSARLGEAGRKQAAGFTWERTASETMETYRDACGLGAPLDT